MDNRDKSDELIIATKELAFQNKERGKRAEELIIANKELAFQNEEKENRAAELIIANKELVFQNEEKGKRATELAIANKELAFQNEEKENRAAELIIANKELVYQNEEKEKRAAELIIANKELAFQNEEKENRAAELIIANKELVYQNEEKEKRAAELIIANKELAFQNEEKENRAAELIIANKELVYQNEEKEKRAAELIIANKELVFQNEEKEKRGAELIIANKELVFQNEEKEKRAAELIISTLADTTERKKNEEHIGRLAAIVEFSDDAIISISLEGIIKSWNKGGERMFGYTAEQAVGRDISLLIPSEYIDEEKNIFERIRNNEIINHFETIRIKKSGERVNVSITASPLKDQAGNIIGISKIVRDITLRRKAGEQLIEANKNLLFQKEEKEKRAAELLIANKELVFQNEEKEKRALELEVANKDLESFSYSVSHDLRAPLRAINGFTQVLVEDYLEKLDDEGKDILNEIIFNSDKMGQLIDNLLEFSRIGKQNLSFVDIDMKHLLDTVITGLKQENPNRKLTITIKDLINIQGDRNTIKQVFINLISNAFKYTSKKEAAMIEIGSYRENNYYTYYVKDNGAGFDMNYYDKLFGVFQRLHSSNEFEGTGVGLAIIHKIISKHEGKVWAEGKVDEGACFYISLLNHHK